MADMVMSAMTSSVTSSMPSIAYFMTSVTTSMASITYFMASVTFLMTSVAFFMTTVAELEASVLVSTAVSVPFIAPVPSVTSLCPVDKSRADNDCNSEYSHFHVLIQSLIQATNC